MNLVKSSLSSVWKGKNLGRHGSVAQVGFSLYDGIIYEVESRRIYCWVEADTFPSLVAAATRASRPLISVSVGMFMVRLASVAYVGGLLPPGVKA